MANGYTRDRTLTLKALNVGLEYKEVRELSVEHIKKLGDILAKADQWKILMSRIPGMKNGGKRFDCDDVEILAQALKQDHSTSGFELLIQEWGTMEEWGTDESGRRSRPKVVDLFDLCRQIHNYTAASYINHEILGRKALQEPTHGNSTLHSLQLDSFSIEHSLPELQISIEEYKFEEDLVEDTIETSSFLEDNSDIFDPSMPIPPEQALQVPYVKFSYLYHITNGFEEGRQIGKGGFSEVFKGETSRSKKLMAIKKLKDVPDARDLMNFEVDHLKRLKHPNIIDLYGYSNDSPTTPCLIYPYMANGSLDKRLLKYKEGDPKHLTAKQRLDIGLGVSQGINHIHRLHEGAKVLIHRDIKSSNILLDDTLQPKVADFGLLRMAVSGDDLMTTCTQYAKGTPAYMPPEALMGDCSAKWDVWSFGVVLLELLTSLPVIDREREDHDLVSHIDGIIGENKMDALKSILDSCWKDGMIQPAVLIYELCKSQLLVKKGHRANMHEVVDKIETIIPKESLKCNPVVK